MAQRDRSQGFGFMYVNIAKVLEEQKEVSAESVTPVSTKNVHHANFNRDTEAMPTTKDSQVKPSTDVVKLEGRAQAMAQIKENLDRLQSLHHRLHAMLEELNKISSSPKRGKN